MFCLSTNREVNRHNLAKNKYQILTYHVNSRYARLTRNTLQKRDNALYRGAPDIPFIIIIIIIIVFLGFSEFLCKHRNVSYFPTTDFWKILHTTFLLLVSSEKVKILLGHRICFLTLLKVFILPGTFYFCISEYHSQSLLNV